MYVVSISHANAGSMPTFLARSGYESLMLKYTFLMDKVKQLSKLNRMQFPSLSPLNNIKTQTTIITSFISLDHNQLLLPSHPQPTPPPSFTYTPNSHLPDMHLPPTQSPSIPSPQNNISYQYKFKPARQRDIASQSASTQHRYKLVQP